MLRQYQQEAIKSIPESGRYLIHLATGLGKTYLASQIPRKGKLLWLSHREELVWQPKEYFPENSYGVEQGKVVSNGEEIISASVQSIVKRLEKFSPNDFDIIIVDECHRSSAKTYLTIINYFKPRLVIGLSATPNRADGQGLDKIFEKIIFSRDLKWGIQNGFLSNLECLRVNIGYDISNIKKKMDDFSINELDKAINENKYNKAIAQAYYQYARGQTVIFGCSVEHAENIAKEIPRSEVITGKTKNREEILKRFRAKEFKCLINCQVLTEGINIPELETIIMARPTQSNVFYTQAIGRVLRLAKGKGKALLIDCCGNTGKHNICTAPSLLGLSLDLVPKNKQEDVIGDLFDLEYKIIQLSDVPESWIKNTEVVKLWAKEHKFNLHNVNYFKYPDGKMAVKLPDNKSIVIEPIDKLGMIKSKPAQEIFDRIFTVLSTQYLDCRPLWDLNIIKSWGKYSASDKQKDLIRRRNINIDLERLTKGEASLILNRILK